MAGIARDEDGWQSIVWCITGIIETFGQALANFIDRPPDGILYIETLGAENALCCGNQHFQCDIAIARPFSGAK